MARFVIALFAVAVTIALTPFVYAVSKDDVVGSVFFLDSGREHFLRRDSVESKTEEDIFATEETAAAVAVLLGVSPPVLLNAASSAKLDGVLSPNPFKRPRAVVALTIHGVVLQSFTTEEIKEIFKSWSFEQRPYSVNGHQEPLELSGQDVTLQLLNGKEYDYGLEHLEQKLKDLVEFLGGSFHTDDSTNLVTLKVSLPLSDQFSISMDLHKRADWMFATELVALFKCLESASRHQRGPQQRQSQAKLFMGTYTALEMLDEESVNRKDASMLFMYTASQILSALEDTFDGHIVGVYTISSITSPTSALPMFHTKETRWARSMLDEGISPSPSSIAPNQTQYDEQVHTLIGRSIVVAVTLILIIATGLGSCFLFLMPLTRDTLLYANVKLD